VQAGPVPQPLSISLAGVNGVNRIQDPGRRCADGGSGQYRHASIEAPLPPAPSGNISSTVLGGVLRGFFDVHHDGAEPVGTPLSGSAATAFLQGTESHVTMSNQRGSVQLRFSAGTCANPTLNFDGTTVSGSGTWTVDPNSTTGSYHPSAPNVTTGSGTFTLSLGVAPGADNPWSLSLNGSISVPQPSLKVEVVDTSWGNLGVDYATRRPTVTYRITNTGPGDTFNPVLTGVSSPTPGVSALNFVPQALPDLRSGDSTIVSQRFQLALLTGPCALIILNCQFDSKLSVSMPDVLDKADSPPPSATVHARTPNLPPPLA
jgi:hypothetical protein